MVFILRGKGKAMKVMSSIPTQSEYYRDALVFK